MVKSAASFRIPALALCLFTLLAVIWWFPVLQTMSTMAAGIGGDPFQTLWRFVRLGEVVRQGSLLIPEEQPLMNLGPLPWLPFHLLFGEVVGYNLVWFLAAVLSGWCTFLLARAWRAPLALALLAGALVEFSPYRLSQALGHFGAMQLWWIPAALLALTLWRRTGRVIWGIISGLLIVGTAWTEHQLFMVLLLFLLIAGFWHTASILAHLRARLASVIVVALFVVVGAVLPFLPTLKVAASPASYFNPGQAQRERFSARLETLFLPAPFHPFRNGVSDYGTDISSAADHVHALGLLLSLSVAATFLWKPRRRKDWALLAVAITGVVLALGPVFRLGSVVIPLPGALVDAVPVASAIRAMGRFVALAVIALPLLLALRLSFLPLPRLARFLLVGLLALEILPPLGFPRLPVETTLAAALREIPGGSLLVVPAFTNYRVGSEHLYLSALHRHPLVANSALERGTDPRRLQTLVGTPVVSELALGKTEDFPLPTVFGQDLASVAPAAFASQNIRAVLYDMDPPGGVISRAHDVPTTMTDAERGRVRTFLRETLGMREEQLGSAVFLYRAAPPESSRVPIAAIRGSGWRLKQRSSAGRAVELAERADLLIYAVRRPADTVVLAADVGGKAGQRMTVKESSGRVTTVDLPVSGRARIPLGIPPLGFSAYTLTLDVPGLILENPRIHISGGEKGTRASRPN